MRQLRCSELPALDACPSWLNDGEPSEVAALGSRVHAALAAYVRGEELPGLDDEAEMLVQRGVKAWAAVKANFPYPEVEREYAVSCGGITLTGHPDVGRPGFSVLDWKTGWKERDYWLQLLGYAYLVGADKAVVVWLRDTRTPFEVLPVPPDKEIEKRIADIVARDGERTPCDYCSWCALFACCAERAAADSYAVQAFEGAKGEMLSDSDLVKLWPLAAGVKRTLKAFRAAVVRRLEHDGPLDLGDGTELRLTETPRTTIDSEVAWPVLWEHLGQNSKAVAACVKIEKGEVSKALRARAKRGDKQKAVSEFYSELHRCDALVALKPTRKIQQAKKEGSCA